MVSLLFKVNVWTDVADPFPLSSCRSRVGHIFRRAEAMSWLGRVAFQVVAPAAVFVVAFYLGLMLVR